MATQSSFSKAMTNRSLRTIRTVRLLFNPELLGFRLSREYMGLLLELGTGIPRRCLCHYSATALLDSHPAP